MCRAVTYEYRLKIDIALRLPYVVATSHQELPETATRKFICGEWSCVNDIFVYQNACLQPI